MPVDQIGLSCPPAGICWKASLLTITRSYLYLPLPLTHWPSTRGVLLTFRNGPCPPHFTGPTTVCRLVAAMASRTSPFFSDLLRESASAAISNSAWAKPIGCVHCFFVPASYASASCLALCLVSEELKGCEGLHQTSVVRPSPRSPGASMAPGNSSALPSVITFGRKPCCRACVRKVLASGGISTPVTISTLSALNFAICALKFCVPFWYRPGSVRVKPICDSGLGKPRSLSPQALPSPSLGNSPPTFLLVVTVFQPLVKLAMTSSRPQNTWYVQLKPLAGSP